MIAKGSFLGKEFDYWLELDRTKGHTEQQLILENARLRAKVSFYEHKLDMCNSFREVVDE